MMRFFMLKKKRTTNLIHLLSLLFFISTSAYSQEKYEKEYRIKTAKVPQAAQEFIHSAGFAKKVKWYREEGLTSNSIEAKTKHHKTKYSVEINTVGEIEDVEYIIQWEDIPALTRINIERFLDSNYQKKRLVKIQVQLTGEKEELLQALVEPQEDPNLITQYEIVLNGVRKGTYERYEYLFSQNGKMKRKAKIILKNTDHLEY